MVSVFFLLLWNCFGLLVIVSGYLLAGREMTEYRWLVRGRWFRCRLCGSLAEVVAEGGRVPEAAGEGCFCDGAGGGA